MSFQFKTTILLYVSTSTDILNRELLEHILYFLLRAEFNACVWGCVCVCVFAQLKQSTLVSLQDPRRTLRTNRASLWPLWSGFLCSLPLWDSPTGSTWGIQGAEKRTLAFVCLHLSQLPPALPAPASWQLILKDSRIDLILSWGQIQKFSQRVKCFCCSTDLMKVSKDHVSYKGHCASDKVAVLPGTN